MLALNRRFVSVKIPWEEAKHQGLPKLRLLDLAVYLIDNAPNFAYFINKNYLCQPILWLKNKVDELYPSPVQDAPSIE